MLTDEVLELELEMTTLCNAKCPLCYRNYKSYKLSPYAEPHIRPIEDIVRQLDRYKSLEYVMLVGSMSEPTLYPDFLKLVEYLKSRHIRIEICTNGDTRTDGFWLELGNRLDPEDAVYFTICGSTQEMHSRYRMGTSLQNILHNASMFRNVGKGNDYAQCIRFNYNSDDLDSDDFRRLISQFSHVYMTETFYPKDMSNYDIPFSYGDFIPNRHKLDKYNKIKRLATAGFKSLTGMKADCQSLEFRRQQIDVFGNVYPCYLYLESSDGKKWDNDYTRIIDLKCQCCKYCSRIVKDYCKRNNLEYII